MDQSSQPASVSIELVHVLLRTASEVGIPVTGISENAGLAPSGSKVGPTRVSLEQFQAVWDELAQRSEDPDFGLRLGEASLPQGHLLSSIMMNCRTVGQALEKLTQYHDLMTDVVRVRIQRDGGLARLACGPASPGIHMSRHHVESVLALLASTFYRLTENEASLIEALFTHAQPDSIAEHRRIFRCPLAFECPNNELVVRQEAFGLPIFLANAELLETLEAFARSVLEELHAPETWSGRVTHGISQHLLQGKKPTIRAMARELAISARHLQTQLSEENTNYRELLNEVRKEMALGYLADSAMTCSEIAFLLGYSEQSAFNHAFKRWTGSSPLAHRRASSAEVPEVD